MSRLKELIQELCPDGVEYVELGTICDIKTGKGVTKKDATKDGEFPIISGGIEPLGMYSKYNREANTVTIARAGGAGYVNYMVTRFYLNDKCFSIIPQNNYVEKLNSRFLYFYLKNREQDIMDMKSTGSVPTINTQKLSSIKIPLPPPEIQKEIVKILDKFTEYDTELQSELQDRLKQYEYYRDKLLSRKNFSSENQVELLPLSEVCNILDNQRKPIAKSARRPGQFPYYGANGIQDYVDSYIFEGEFILVGEDGSVITDSGRPIVNWATGKIWVNNHAHIISESKKANLRYLYFYLQTLNIEKLVHGNIPKLTGGDLRDIKVPIPPKNIQNHIVEVLDNFDKICSDLKIGLPAEIERRQQQYEFYRDAILTFVEKIGQTDTLLG